MKLPTVLYLKTVFLSKHTNSKFIIVLEWKKHSLFLLCPLWFSLFNNHHFVWIYEGKISKHQSWKGRVNEVAVQVWVMLVRYMGKYTDTMMRPEAEDHFPHSTGKRGRRPSCHASVPGCPLGVKLYCNLFQLMTMLAFVSKSGSWGLNVFSTYTMKTSRRIPSVKSYV